MILKILDWLSAAAIKLRSGRQDPRVEQGPRPRANFESPSRARLAVVHSAARWVAISEPITGAGILRSRRMTGGPSVLCSLATMCLMVCKIAPSRVLVEWVLHKAQTWKFPSSRRDESPQGPRDSSLCPLRPEGFRVQDHQPCYRPQACPSQGALPRRFWLRRLPRMHARMLMFRLLLRQLRSLATRLRRMVAHHYANGSSIYGHPRPNEPPNVGGR